jgi:hypothetical protein
LSIAFPPCRTDKILHLELTAAARSKACTVLIKVSGRIGRSSQIAQGSRKSVFFDCSGQPPCGGKDDHEIRPWVRGNLCSPGCDVGGVKTSSATINAPAAYPSARPPYKPYWMPCFVRRSQIKMASLPVGATTRREAPDRRVVRRFAIFPEPSSPQVCRDVGDTGQHAIKLHRALPTLMALFFITSSRMVLHVSASL